MLICLLPPLLSLQASLRGRTDNDVSSMALLESVRSGGISLPSSFMNNLQHNKPLLSKPLSRADKLVLEFCDAGQYLDMSSVQCANCPVGKFQPHDQSRYCLKCPSGKYGLKKKATKCAFNECDAVRSCRCIMHHTSCLLPLPDRVPSHPCRGAPNARQADL